MTTLPLSRPAVIASIAAAFAATACDTYTTAGGQVVDTAGRPVIDAVVSASKGHYQQYVLHTDTAGRFSIGFTGGFRAPDAVVRACLGTFISAEIHIPDGRHADSLVLRLLPHPSGNASQDGQKGAAPCA
jgi:hypothetical protein